MTWWLSQLSAGEIVRKIRTRIIPNLRHLPRSRIRACRACAQNSLILAYGRAEEFQVCIRCRANLRYELLAMYLRRNYQDLSTVDVLELDPASPLRPLLAGARNYMRSFYREAIEPGVVRPDGAVCQDIMNLKLPSESLDLIVSSDVLEHVPDPAAAFRESVRVLRPGGAHIFTVPPRQRTLQRARLDNGEIQHLVQPPEYHFDPLDPRGVLAFWDFGSDLPVRFGNENLRFSVVAGPEGVSGSFVWEARKQSA